MTANNPQSVPFEGKRIQLVSPKTFDDVMDALLSDIGKTPVDAEAIATKFESWEAYEREMQTHVGPSGFMLFMLIDHGIWIKKASIARKMMRVILGNPLIAITMIRHDLTAGLFAPVELLVTEEEGGRTSVTYVQPSSLMVVETNDELLEAALKLDTKLAALVAKIV
jgi:uncharacterized protein (DUF302 family)